MCAALDALELIHLATRSRRGSVNRGNRVTVRAGELKCQRGRDRRQMPGVPRTDDDTGDAWLIENPAHRDSADAGPMTGANVAQPTKQALEQFPAAELLDDQSILDQRAILERAGRDCGVQPPLGEEPSGERAVTEQANRP